jgi:YbgC/YbaW family acyl-CoA thioester hydrolase
MAVTLSRRVDYPMIDSANIAYYPRIYDLAHRFFEECWQEICGFSYPELINVRKIGFPIVNAKTDFIAPLRYGDTVKANIWISRVGKKSCTWQYRFFNQSDELLWNSEHITVCVDMDSLQSILIPDDLRKGLEMCDE